ncbi:MAG TPA: protein-L-isoaspartate O-methyltransferase, partial [Dehalococcoidia bacterium]|nr:protein-L-isoaspartate O-methyltransferase [Dehalococcoidia bacterium]
LGRLGYRTIALHPARDDVLGWPEGGPYDAIIVTAAAPHVPNALIAQLALDGRLVIPVGSREEQLLTRITRLEAGTRTEHLGGCRFVPLIGPDAWPNDEPTGYVWA